MVVSVTTAHHKAAGSVPKDAGWSGALDHVHGGRGEKQHDQKQRQNAGERLCFEHEDAPELGETGRILTEFEHPQRAEQPGALLRDAARKRDRNRRNAQKIDESRERESVLSGACPAAQAACRRSALSVAKKPRQHHRHTRSQKPPAPRNSGTV